MAGPMRSTSIAGMGGSGVVIPTSIAVRRRLFSSYGNGVPLSSTAPAGRCSWRCGLEEHASTGGAPSVARPRDGRLLSVDMGMMPIGNLACGFVVCPHLRLAACNRDARRYGGLALHASRRTGLRPLPCRRQRRRSRRAGYGARPQPDAHARQKRRRLRSTIALLIWLSVREAVAAHNHQRRTVERAARSRRLNARPRIG